jgi:hypothetical protein
LQCKQRYLTCSIGHCILPFDLPLDKICKGFYLQMRLLQHTEDRKTLTQWLQLIIHSMNE